MAAPGEIEPGKSVNRDWVGLPRTGHSTGKASPPLYDEGPFGRVGLGRLSWLGAVDWMPGMPGNMSRHPSGDSGVNSIRNAVSRRSDRFLAGLADYKAVTFVSHIQPDPDSLGSMVGLAHLVETCLGMPTRLTRDGAICRADACPVTSPLKKLLALAPSVRTR